jgi:hypothetical protein
MERGLSSLGVHGRAQLICCLLNTWLLQNAFATRKTSSKIVSSSSSSSSKDEAQIIMAKPALFRQSLLGMTIYG